MWLKKTDTEISALFAPKAVYTESWGPEYRGVVEIQHWFDEWNTRGSVRRWEIRQFFHKEDQTIVEWFFEAQMADGRTEAFDGMTLIEWTAENQIRRLKEFGCNIDRYDPYAAGGTPVFRDEKALWF